MRFNTTLKWHHKLTKFKWYKKWHDFRFSHHVHVATLFATIFMVALSNLIPLSQNQKVLAANGNWTETTFNGNASYNLGSSGTYSGRINAANNNVSGRLGNPFIALNDGIYIGANTLSHTYYNGERFTSVSVPQGATITSAYLKITANYNEASGVNSYISAEKADNAAVYVANATDYTNRYNNRTTATVAWDNIPTWTVGQEYSSPDIKTVIQEVVDRPGWVSGNAISILWEDRDSRSTRSPQSWRGGHQYNTDPTKAPLLEINYTNIQSSGTYTSAAISPTGLYGDWGNVTFNASASLNGGPANTYLSVQVCDGNGNPINNAGITAGTNTAGTNTGTSAPNNNLAGFYVTSGATGTINMSGISTATYPALKLKATLNTTNLSNTPSLNDWAVAYSYDVTAPTIPSNLSASVTSSSAALSWDASTDNNESGVLGYVIERATDSGGVPGAFSQVPVGTGCYGNGTKGSQNGILTTGTSCTDSGLTAGTKYYYRVKAVDNVGNYSGYGGEHNSDTNTVGLWHLNEGSGSSVTDASGNVSAGTMNGDSYWTYGGKLGAAFNASDNDYISIPDSSNWAFGTNNFTIEMWVKWNSLADVETFIGQSNGGGNTLKWSILRNYPSTNDMTFYTRNPAQTENMVTWSWPGAQTATWYHVAVRRSGNNWDLLVNGVGTGGTQNASFAVPDVSSTLRVGEVDTWEYFDGIIDEIRISNAARSTADILNYYNNANTQPFSATTPAVTVPTGLTVGTVTSSTIPLTWNKVNDSNLAGYKIERAEDTGGNPGVWNEVADLELAELADPNSPSWTDTGRAANTKYYYRIRAYDDAGNNSAYDVGNNPATVTVFATAGDGNVNGLGSNWATVRSTGSSAEYTDASHRLSGTWKGGDNVNWMIIRSFFAFDTASIPDGANISSASLNVYKAASATGNDNAVGMFAGTQSSTTTLSTGDYNGYTGSEIASRKNYSQFGEGYTAWSLSNVSNISKTGATKLCIRIDKDIDNTPSVLADYDVLSVYRSEEAGTDKDPYLSVTYTMPVSASTLPATPALADPVDYTNDSTPALTGSSTSANVTVKLYKGAATEIASVTSDGSGNFSFGNTDYSGSLDEGENTLFVRAFNADGGYSQSGNRTISLDSVAPSAPDTRTAAKVNNDSGADIDDNAWNGHNNGNTVYFAWSGAADPEPASLIKRYWVYFGPNAGAVPRTDGQATSDSTVNVVKTLSNPVSGTDYYLRIQTEDNAGNISSDGAIPTLFTYKFDNTAPSGPTTITHSPVGWSTTNSFDFNWNNWTEANSGLDYYLYNRKTSASEDTYEEFDTINRKVTDVTNPVDLADVEALYTGINYIRVYAVDKAGNTSSAYASDFFFYSGNIAGPTITPTPTSNTTNSFAFNLAKPGGINAVGYYCGVESSIDYSNSTFIDIVSPPASVTINGKTTNVTVNGDNVSLSAFAAATQTGINYLYCATQDNSGNIGWSTKSTSEAFTVNTTAPSAPDNVSITDASDRGESIWALTVAWAPLSSPTPDFAGYKVYRCVDADCSNDANYSERASVATNIYSEAGLNNTKDYYYKIKSYDNVGNTSDYTASVHKTPTGKYTTPPEYTSNPAAETKATSVKISWTTNRPSNSIVQYGATVAYGQEASKSTEAVTDHEVEILGLTPGSTYHFRVQSLDADRDYEPSAAYSADYTFSTSQAPGISDVEVSEIRLSSAIITWKTTSASSSKILYGTSTTYGSTYTDTSASQTTTHTVRLTGLSDATTYNFKIQGTDIEGNILNSDNYVFTTLTFPRLSALKIEQVPNTPTSTIKVTFSSNVPTTSQVTVAGNGGKEAATYELKTAHEMTISGLRDNTTYSVTARGRDQYGNEASTVSGTYKTEFDTRPPAISDIAIETSIIGFGTDAKGQVLVSWVTDEPSTSQIEYAPGASGNEYASRTQEDTGLVTNHVVIISDLKTSSPYHFRVVSKDGAANTGRSEDNSVLTEQASESVIDLIVKSLQSTIGWIFGVFSN